MIDIRLTFSNGHSLSGLDHLSTTSSIPVSFDDANIDAWVTQNTDIKPENILVGVASRSVLDEFAEDEAKEPSPRKVLADRIIYLSRNDFGDIKTGLSPGKPVLTDCDVWKCFIPSYPTQFIPCAASHTRCTMDIQRGYIESGFDGKV